MRCGVAAIKHKKSCCIVAARGRGGNKKPSRRSSRCRCARPRQRDARNLVVSLPRGRVAATKNLRGADFVATAPGPGNEMRGTEAATKNLHGAVLVAAASDPGNETQEILLYSCRAGLWRQRNARNLVVSLPRGKVSATKNLRGAVLVAAAPGLGNETSQV